MQNIKILIFLLLLNNRINDHLIYYFILTFGRKVSSSIILTKYINIFAHEIHLCEYSISIDSTTLIRSILI